VAITPLTANQAVGEQIPDSDIHADSGMRMALWGV